MKILAVQNRMGIGDTVIFLPFIEAISRKFNTPVSLLVKKSSKVDEYIKQTAYLDKVIFLERNNKKNERHNGFMGSIRLAQDLKRYKFDKIFIFNSSLRFNLIARLANIKEIYQYPLLKKTNQHIVQPANYLIKKNLGVNVVKDPQIEINSNLIKEAESKFNINSSELNILLGIGGSGPTKRIPSETFLSVIEKIYNFKKSKFFLATGKKDDEQIILNQILSSKFRDKCIPLDDLSIADTLPIIKNCNISICNDSSFSHLSSALGIKTITLMADTPLIYGSYSSNMYPILPDGETTVGHNTFGKDKINPDKIFDKFISILN
ncbi:glycosyltransferase family 9 protein [Candidatus Pelagibacter bacterium nBUS_29]|uniref:glycosyltransferase family 9 protein n=1 Tax=Candidatus Pelagibacter bacterium nBUS_29 TaxID=3374190 RepID=UPI003EC0A07C